MMAWIKIILDLLVKGLGWWRERSLLQAGQSQEREKENAKTITALEARANVTDANADSMLKPPSER